MKLLVSDYDGTLLPDPKDLKILRRNIESINKFRKDGNIFILSTGRPYVSIKKEIERHEIELDYLCCQDGAVIFDRNYQLLRTNYLTETQVSKSIQIISKSQSVLKVTMYNPYDVTDKNNDVIEISIKRKKLSRLKALKKEIEEYVEGVEAFGIFDYVYIKPMCSKGAAIKHILENFEDDIDKSDVYTIGDNSNDLDMLQEYNGYKMLTSYPNLYFKGIKTCRHVHTLIRKISG